MSHAENINRRSRERFRLQPGYCGVAVRRPDTGEVMHGHAYDISESGARIELDERLSPGETIQIWVDFGDLRISSRARVIWQFDNADEPGPVRMAVDFSEQISATDRQRLISHVSMAGLLRAA